MFYEYDHIAGLADPSAAIFYGCTLIFATALIAFAAPQKWSAPTIKLYLRGIGFSAEILVAVGIIGLITFAGRAKLDSKEQGLLETQLTSESAFNQRLLALATDYCTHPAYRLTKSPTIVNANVSEACALFHTYAPMYRPNIDWGIARKEFDEIAARGDIDTRLASVLHAIAQSIGEMQLARSAASNAPFDRSIITKHNSWEVVLTCAVLAVLGIGLKIARAARELQMDLNARQAPGESILN